MKFILFQPLQIESMALKYECLCAMCMHVWVWDCLCQWQNQTIPNMEYETNEMKKRIQFIVEQQEIFIWRGKY